MPEFETMRELTSSEIDQVAGGLSVNLGLGAHLGVNASDVTGAVSGLVAHDGDGAEVLVELTRLSRDDDEARHATIVCTIAVRLTSRDFDETSAVARHAYAAIDKAVSMIRRRSLRRAERLA